MFKVKIGRSKSAREILGTQTNVESFVIIGEGGHHYTFSNVQDAWGRIQAMCVFLPVRADLDHLGYRWIGTVDGQHVGLFRSEWVELSSTEEMSEEDPRVATLLRAIQRGLKMDLEDVERKMAEGGSA